ncbi:hypothetical protein VTK73DRAFT_7149 [Phialemonium thermophilum]|uniref:Short-chain dehydrogenase n=1 Tax=Phialemonium thermophilum TaxID=223376 RepID=A0ABR3WGB2_9PEZI
MPSTTHPEFNANTEGLEVAEAFADGIRGKTIVITGVNPGGIGFSTAQAFASQSPAHLIIVGRNEEKLQTSIDALKAQYPSVDYRPLKMDLASQTSVRSAAKELLSWDDVPVVNILVNNAAVMLVPERTLSEDGIEITFATNHVGHFLFTCLLMPKLIRAAETNPRGTTRIVNISAASGYLSTVRWSDVNFEKTNKDLPEEERPNQKVHDMWAETDVHEKSYTPLAAYNQSKVANVLFSVALTKRLYEKYGILSFALHPGVIPTELGRYATPQTVAAIRAMSGTAFTFKTLGAGASTTLVAALDPRLGPGEQRGDLENYGTFLDDCQISDRCLPSTLSNEGAQRLWNLSENMVKQKFDW